MIVHGVWTARAGPLLLKGGGRPIVNDLPVRGGE